MTRPLAGLTAALFASLLVCAAPAQSQGQQQGDASIRLEYQFIRTGSFVSGDAEFGYWTTDSQVAMLSGDYAINDRWRVFAALPYVRKRFQPAGSDAFLGGDPHNPNDPYWIDFVPPDTRFWDDGDYHGALQDFSIGLSYRIDLGPWVLAPYISYGVPASDYPFFAKAAIGKNLWTVPVGMSFSYVPYFSDWHFGGSAAYVFSEKPLDVNVDYLLIDLAAGYWFKAYLSVEAFLNFKNVFDGVSLLSPRFIDGDPAGAVYPDDWDTEDWWNHDRMVGNQNLNVGLGIDYFFSRNWKVSGTAYKSFRTNESNEVDYAYTLGLTRYFSGE